MKKLTSILIIMFCCIEIFAINGNILSNIEQQESENKYINRIKKYNVWT